MNLEYRVIFLLLAIFRFVFSAHSFLEEGEKEMFRWLDPRFLHGKWSHCDDGFLWQGVKLVRKRGSDNPYDYWVSYASGACLATSVQCLTARFDPTSGFLHFNPTANRTMGGPWRLLISFRANLDAPSADDAVFFTKSGLVSLHSKRPDLFRSAWNNEEANQELMRLATEKWTAPFGYFGTLPREGGASTAVEEAISHGAVWGFGNVHRIDEDELRRHRQLASIAEGRQIS